MFKPKTLAIAAFLLSGFATGAIETVLPSRGFTLVEAVLILLPGFFVFAWYCLDARQRGFHRRAWLNTAVVAIAPLALPYYLLRTRGAWRGILATVLGVVALVGYFAAAIGGAYAAFLVWTAIYA